MVRRTGSRDTTGGEVHNWEALQACRLLHQVVGCLDLLGEGVELLLCHGARLANFAHNRSLVPHGFYDIPGAGFSLGANERGALGDAAQCLA